MKILHFPFILFILIVAANDSFAQTPRGMIAGTVTDNDEVPVAGAKISVKRKNSTDYNRIQTVSSNNNGNFTAHVEAGIYVVITEYKCRSSRIEDFEVPANQTAPLNVKLAYEDCEQKEAAEDLEWKACEQEVSVAGLQITDSDKAEITNRILEELFKFEDGFIRDNYYETIFSTDNLDAARIKPFPNLNVSFLSPQKLQAKADSSKEGRIGYYAFSALQPGNNCAFIGVSMKAAESKNKPADKDQVIYSCPVGTQMTYLFRKDSGKWRLKQSRRF